ncbi:uncharacterized protein [Rutidosis leptorrhynchoides]|uniref:uncharacterized protein n=1 Tax=Rutidosis leptorrhynchoides TaxID=125765 RepID=UPI003A9A4014
MVGHKCGEGTSRVKRIGKKGSLGGKSKDKRLKGKDKQVKGDSNKCDKGESCAPAKREWVKRKLIIKCDFVLLISKQPDCHEWEVKTYQPHHTCKQSRKLPFCTYKFLSTKVLPKLATNPKVPIKAVKAFLETDLELVISEYKAYRALKTTTKVMQGDYQSQYGELRDYILELQRSNPGTTVKLDVEPGNLKSKTRVFKRIYVCLGALKKGFKAIGRDLLGLDGCFMKEPAKGCILTAVGVDSNNGIYPVAYAIVELECGASWTWFLKCLGEDLDLCSNSNFTFISDRQKGLVHAVENLFPCAEHRHCLRHIHGNMKGSFRGVAYKNHLWRCATVTTVPEFEHAMNQLKEFDNAAYVWLSDIPPHQWARSHFTGRAVSDVLLSNMCEVFNRWLIDARDKPIVTALEYIREYCMKRIVNVIKKKSKCDGPLSIGAAKVFEKIKSEANKCTILWGGNQKYQVSGPAINGQPAEQFVVDMETRTCACRKWELTGIPCKHAVAVNWNMVENGFEFTFEPLNGRHLWPKSGDLYTLVAPKKISTPGRPKKKRRMSANEVDDIGEGGKLSTQVEEVWMMWRYGHNKRGCPKGKGDASTSGGGSVNKKGKAAAIGKKKK